MFDHSTQFYFLVWDSMYKSWEVEELQWQGTIKFPSLRTVLKFSARDTPTMHNTKQKEFNVYDDMKKTTS